MHFCQFLCQVGTFTEMCIRDRYYTDPEESHADPDLIYVASKSGSMDACRNDGGDVYKRQAEYWP